MIKTQPSSADQLGRCGPVPNRWKNSSVLPATHETVIARLDYCAKKRSAPSRIHEWERPVQQLKYSAKLYMAWVSAAAAVEE